MSAVLAEEKQPIRSREEETLQQLARVLDAYWKIPGTNIKVGLDAFIGLIPGFGDFSGILISSYIIFVAAKLGVSTSILVRMVLNVVFDSTIGTVPFFGDIADVFWRSNTRNVALLERAKLQPGRNASVPALLCVSAILFFFIALSFVVACVVVWKLFTLISG